ncbi:MAG: sigma 54-interacting transcriptional regulator, partial [Spirochaetes bacterium]|nr:sigma 54-interacting transcriptional regulator [Spirochaetota bacterium]
DEFIKIFNGKSGFILIKNKNLNKFKIEVIRGISKDKAQNIKYQLKDEIKILFQDENPKIINIAASDLKEIKTNDNFSLLIPLKTGEKIISVVIINDITKKSLTKYDIELIQTISNHASQNLSRILIFKDLGQKIKLKNILIDISNSIEKVFILKDVIDVLMKKLADKFGIIRGMLFLLEREHSNKLSVFTAYNLTEEEISRGIYKVGEGIVGKVVEDGKAISISDINRDSLFLNRMKIRRIKNNPISFIAVPIKISGIVLGVLAIEKYFESIDLLRDQEDMLFLVSGIIANKVKIYQKMSKEKSVLLEENLNLRKELYGKYGIKNIIGKNKKMQEIFELIKMVADSNSSILILGASGTGKELVAKALHFNSDRRHEPFISINCAAIPENLFESELFGYKKGAFTGAGTDKKGKLLLADGGTLFLDEIGEMPMYLQAKILRAIQEREIEPVGSELKIKINIRIVSATNKNPKELIINEKLREDLYYRLNVVEINIPSLKERKDDIPLLVQHFIEKFSKLNNRKIDRISPEALRILQSYHWPGNVRELENIIERAILLSRGNTIEVLNLPSFIIEAGEFQTEELYIGKWVENLIYNEKDNGNAYNSFMKIIEKELIIKSLLFNNRNKVKTSEFLGINRNTLRAKMKQYDIW